MVAENLRHLIGDALQGSPEPDGTVETEAAGDETPTPDASQGGQSEGTTDEDGTEAEAQEGTAVELPDQYFGLDLSGVEPEQRQAILAELRKRDDYIGKLLRDPEPDQATGADEGTEDVEPPAEISDEELLQMLGLNTEDNLYAEEVAKVALPLARQQLAQQQALAMLIEQKELADLDTSWRSSLEGLEREFGALPPGINHERVMEFAAENSIGHPEDAYWRIMGPGRTAVSRSLEQEAAKRQKLNAAKRGASTTRARATNADDDTPLQAKTTSAATKEAARKLFAQLGYDT